MGYRQSVTDSYVHVYNRGAKKMPIFREKTDLLRFLQSLFYFNTQQSMPQNWTRDLLKIGGMHTLVWPPEWEARVPIVSILAFTIMPNHFHLLIKEEVEGGVSKFMHRVSMGYSKFINEKYAENGSLFQGPYKARRVDNDTDLKNLLVYIMIKNPFELYKGGIPQACSEFERAYAAALQNPLNSLAEYTGLKKAAILNHDLVLELSEEPDSFKKFARECMQHRLEQLDSYEL